MIERQCKSNVCSVERQINDSLFLGELNPPCDNPPCGPAPWAGVIKGYGSVFNQRSRLIAEDGKVFYEVINERAFDNVLRETPDVIAVINHDRNQMLGRTSAGTLRLSVDEKGLRYDILVPDTQLGRDTITMVEAGNYIESSFKYYAAPRDIEWSRAEDGILIREVMEVSRLSDVSIVTQFGAFPHTDVAVSSRLLEYIEKTLETRDRVNEEMSLAPTLNNEQMDKNNERIAELEAELEVLRNSETEEENEQTEEAVENTEVEEPTDERAEVSEGSDATATDEEAVEEEEDEREEQSEESEEETEEVTNEAEERSATEAETEAERQLNEDINIETNNSKKVKKMSKDLFYNSVRSAIETDRGGTIKLSARGPAEGSTDAMEKAIPNYVEALDIVGYQPIWVNFGVDLMPGAQGTFTLPYESPIIGELVAEMAAYTKDTTTPDGILIQPHRYGVQKEFTLETINSATPEFLNAVLLDMLRGADRAITKDIYTKMLGAAGVVTGATDISKASFDLLMSGAEVENDGAFFSERTMFFEAKGTPIDAGSGRFLVERAASVGLGAGVTYDGVPYWYSKLFENPANEGYVVYGDPSKIFVADYGLVEVIIDKYTKAAEGGVIFTVNKIAGLACKNPQAFAKSENLIP